MIDVYAHSVLCVTAVGAASLPFAVLRAQTIEQMKDKLDHDLLHNASWMAYGPKRHDVRAFEIMDSLGGRKGLLHILGQARLITGICGEATKLRWARAEVEDLKQKRRELWRSVGLCLLLPSRHAHSVARIVADMAASLDSVLIEIDAARDTAF